MTLHDLRNHLHTGDFASNENIAVKKIFFRFINSIERNTKTKQQQHPFVFHVQIF